jgi:putative glutamine amidotransferase
MVHSLLLALSRNGIYNFFKEKKMNINWKIGLFIIPLIMIAASCTPQTEEKISAERSAIPADAVRLTVCYPSAGSLRALINLKERGIFDPPGLHVTGIYHEKEFTDYQRSRDMVRNQGLDWISFEEISGELTPDNLFQTNPLTSDYRRIFEASDGLIFFGGADIPPYLYGEKTRLLTSIRTPYRHFFELSFVFHLLGGHQDPAFSPLLEEAPEFPILGICLGEQTLNVGTGGTMIQDIWSEIYGLSYLEDITQLDMVNWHTNPWSRLYPRFRLFSYNLHPIRLAEGIFIDQMGFKPEDNPLILSAHHQAADELGKGFKTAAATLDGKVKEALAHSRYPHVLGIQFHPEFPLLWDEEAAFKMTPDDETEFNPLQKLSRHPPSLDFHKKIWNWLAEKISLYHSRSQE